MELEIRKAVKEDETRIKELFIEMLQTIYSKKKVEGYEDGYLDKFLITMKIGYALQKQMV